MTPAQQAFNWIVRLAIERVNAMDAGSASQEATASALDTMRKIVAPELEPRNGDTAN